ncbi:hypothetical protein [Rhodoflexus sp.]
MKPICCGLLLLLVLLSHMLCGQSKTNAYSINPNDDGIYYYVSDKGGEDKFTGGTVVKPFKTLRFVKQVIRNSRKQFNKNVTVFIRGGVYQLSEPLVFTEEDDSYTHVLKS